MNSFKSFFGGSSGPDQRLSELKAKLTELQRERDSASEPSAKTALHEQIEDVTTEILFEELIARVPEGKKLMLARDHLRSAFSQLSAMGNPAIGVLGMIEVAISHGAPIYNEGSPIGCAYLYDYAARMIFRLLKEPAGQQDQFRQVEARLRRVSFERMTDAMANARAWELRRAFDSILENLAPMLDERKLRVFVSYAHKDEALRAELDTHLAMLRRERFISDWYDGEICAGGEWRREIDHNLETAQVILLLVSANYLASDFCFGVEVMRAIERHNERTAVVIPIILKSCDWKSAPFGKLKALPKDGRPILSWPDRDEALADVVLGIRRVIEMLLDQEPRARS